VLAGTHVLTFTAVPSGQGIRMGIDRDEDGYYDRTELDYGTDPADPASHPAVGIEESDLPAITGLTRLTGAFPQPFRSRTAIEFYLAVAGEATVRVFDVGGRLVRRLGQERYPIGRHTVMWDGRNETGGSVAPGVYIVLLEAPGVRHASKVVRAQ